MCPIKSFLNINPLAETQKETATANNILDHVWPVKKNTDCLHERNTAGHFFFLR